jgi:hypothetical protein
MKCLHESWRMNESDKIMMRGCILRCLRGVREAQWAFFLVYVGKNDAAGEQYQMVEKNK